MTIHPHNFMAGGKQKLVKNSEFEHMKEFADKRYDTRDENGNVKTGLKKIYANNMKKGFGNAAVGHLFSSFPYLGYPEEEGRVRESNERLIHKAKIVAPFKGSSYPSSTFTPDYALLNKE